MKKEKQFRYSEIFGRTIQGEGHYTGYPTTWIRFFGCNLECNGFGQDDPTDPSTFDLPYERIDISDITDVFDLPVFDKGCDSSYTWSKRYRHLASLKTASEICDELEEQNKNPTNPEGKFLHPQSGQHIHMCFTGGEPIMSQHAILAIMQELDNRDNTPQYVTIETNGTKVVKPALANYIQNEWTGTEWFWSVSPKLFNTSGEKDAVCPDIVKQYLELDPTGSANGQLKFVVNGTDDSWKEVEEAIQQFRDVGCDWDVWIMPVGATSEGQENIQAVVCEQTFDRGYNFAARVHAWVFDNVIGK